MIVKKYILPMFESEGKKSLDRKYNKMHGIGQATGKKFSRKPGSIPGDKGQKSVYGELKLSEKLVEELDLIREKVDDLNERLEESMYES